MPVKLPPGAVAVDDAPSLPPGAVAVDDQEAPPAPVAGDKGGIRPLTQKERFEMTYPVGAPGQSMGSNIYNTAQNVGVGIWNTIAHPIKTADSFTASLIPKPVLDWASQHGKEGELRRKQSSGQALTKDEQKYLDYADQLNQTPNPIAGAYQMANTRDVPAAAQAAGAGIVTAGLGDLISGGKGAAPRSARIADGQTSALSSVLARTPMNSDKGFIVQDVADAIKDPLRQAAADNPDIVAVALGKDPVKAYGAYQALLTKTKEAFEKTFNSILGKVRNYPIDGQTIASQLSSSDALRRMFPNEAEWVDVFYAGVGSVKTLGELDDVRKLLNDRVKSTYKNAAPTMEEGGKVGATRAGLDLMRQYFYFKLEEATGQDLSGLKRTEGAVMDAERAGVANGPQLTSAHQKHIEPATPARKVAGIIKGAKVATGNFALPVAGYVADTLEGSNLQQLHSYLKRALSDLPQPTPAGTAPEPAPIPPNRPKLGPGGPGSAIQTAPPQPGPGPRPAGSVQYPNPTGISAPPSSAPPRGLGSMAPAPQLQSGPAAYAGPNTVNPTTARTQIAPTIAERTAAPPEAPPAGTGMVVAPDGTITLPRRMLQAPAKVGDIINFQGKKMQVARVFKDGQTALKEVAPPKAAKGPAPTKAAKPVSKAAPPVQTPAQMTDSYSAPITDMPDAPPAASGGVGSMAVKDINLDPERFQYKLGTDAKGVKDTEQGQKWNPDLSGVVSVWRDPANSKTYVVNGHHRMELAIRNGVKNIDVRTIEAPTAAEARQIGALQNIAEGRGTPLDAAKFMRDSKLTVDDLKSRGIKLGEATAQKGLALSRLDQPLFDKVVSGKMREGRGVAIGTATDSPIQQDALVKMIDQREAAGKKVSDDVVEELGRLVNSAPEYVSHQVNLFGEQEMRQSLAFEKAEVSQAIRARLGNAKRTYQSVSTESKANELSKVEGQHLNPQENAKRAAAAGRALAVYDKLSTRAGKISDILNNAARELAEGGNEHYIKSRAYSAIESAIPSELR